MAASKRAAVRAGASTRRLRTRTRSCVFYICIRVCVLQCIVYANRVSFSFLFCFFFFFSSTCRFTRRMLCRPLCAVSFSDNACKRQFSSPGTWTNRTHAFVSFSFFFFFFFFLCMCFKERQRSRGTNWLVTCSWNGANLLFRVRNVRWKFVLSAKGNRGSSMSI